MTEWKRDVIYDKIEDGGWEREGDKSSKGMDDGNRETGGWMSWDAKQT